MKKKYAFIFGIGKKAKGVGAGFGRRLESRGYELYIQYRDEKKIPEIMAEFPKAILFKSELTDSKQLNVELRKLKEQGITPSVAIFSAGVPGTDTAVAPGLTGLEKEQKAIEIYTEYNVPNKIVCFDSLEEVYKGNDERIKIFVISSQAANWDLETCRKYDEVGYHTGMIKVAEISEPRKAVPHFNVEVLFTPSVETGGLEVFREQVRLAGDDIAEGQNNEVYAESVLVKAGI